MSTVDRHKIGRPHIPIEEKIRRGTLQIGRELKRIDRAARGKLPGEVPVVRPVKARSYGAILEVYLAGVESGAVVACELVRRAVARQREERARAAWECIWDQREADRACHFLEQLPHVEGTWGSATLVLEPWQVFVVSLLYGWRVAADPARRRFTTLYLEVGRKAAKSTLMAGLAFYHLLEEGENGASVICGATTGQQARMVFGIMQKMARRSPFLVAHRVQVFSNSVVCPNGEAKPVNSKASSLDGLNPSMIILDESHAQDFGLHDVLKSAQGARANPLLVCPTTAGYDLLSVGYALHQQVEKVLDGVFLADHVLGVIYTLDAFDDWRDERVWVKANPMLGVSPKLEYLRKYCQDAQQVPGTEGEFRVKACSQWMQSAARWISSTAWDRCAEPGLKIEDFSGERCWVGADLAAVDDLAAVAYVFERGEELVVFARCYLPEGVVAARAVRVPYYRIWADDGLLVPTEGTMIDYARIEADIREACTRFQVQTIVFDQWGSTQICGNLANSGLPARVEGKSAKTFTPPSLDFEARVTHGRIRHDGNGLLKWAVLNACVTRRIDGSILPKKDAPESPNKVDPLDAILQAMGARLSTLALPSEYRVLFAGGKRA